MIENFQLDQSYQLWKLIFHHNFILKIHLNKSEKQVYEMIFNPNKCQNYKLI